MAGLDAPEIGNELFQPKLKFTSLIIFDSTMQNSYVVHGIVLPKWTTLDHTTDIQCIDPFKKA